MNWSFGTSPTSSGYCAAAQPRTRSDAASLHIATDAAPPFEAVSSATCACCAVRLLSLLTADCTPTNKQMQVHVTHSQTQCTIDGSWETCSRGRVRESRVWRQYACKQSVAASGAVRGVGNMTAPRCVGAIYKYAFDLNVRAMHHLCGKWQVC